MSLFDRLCVRDPGAVETLSRYTAARKAGGCFGSGSEVCHSPPAGAFAGKVSGRVWYYCLAHYYDVEGCLTEYANTSDLPLDRISLDEAQVFEVMST